MCWITNTCGTLQSKLKWLISFRKSIQILISGTTGSQQVTVTEPAGGKRAAAASAPENSQLQKIPNFSYKNPGQDAWDHFHQCLTIILIGINFSFNFNFSFSFNFNFNCSFSFSFNFHLIPGLDIMEWAGDSHSDGGSVEELTGIVKGILSCIKIQNSAKIRVLIR